MARSLNTRSRIVDFVDGEVYILVYFWIVVYTFEFVFSEELTMGWEEFGMTK